MDTIKKHWALAISPICIILFAVHCTAAGWTNGWFAAVVAVLLIASVVWNYITYGRQLRAETEAANLKECLQQYSEERGDAKAECERRKNAALNIAQHMVRWSNALNGSIGKDITATRHACREVRQGMLAHLAAACDGLTTPWFLSREDARDLLDRASGGLEAARKALLNIPEGEMDTDNN